jgi:hypothetical protein
MCLHVVSVAGVGVATRAAVVQAPAVALIDKVVRVAERHISVSGTAPSDV